jgi:hypothetical protein
LTKVWGEVLAELPLGVRSKWRGGTWATPITDPPRFVVPNPWHKNACDEGLRDVEQALAARLGSGLKVEVVVDGGDTPSPTGATDPAPGSAVDRTPPPPDDEHETVDVSDLRDAHDAATGGVDLLLREFGGELVEEDP